MDPLVADIETFAAAMKDIAALAAHVRAGTATPQEMLAAADAGLKAVALVFPPAAQVEAYVEAAEAIVALGFDLGLIQVNHGPLKPVFGGPALPEMVFGHIPFQDEV